MITWLRQYANIIAVIGALSVLAYTHHYAYVAGEANIQEKFDKYRENVDEQINRNKAAKAVTEAEQAAKYQMAQTGYAGAIDVLNERMRNAEAVPRCGSVQVAGQGGVAGTVPSGSTDPAITYKAIETRRGICESSFYWDALMDVAQCRELIKLQPKPQL
jgi:hypothetical protein